MNRLSWVVNEVAFRITNRKTLFLDRVILLTGVTAIILIALVGLASGFEWTRNLMQVIPSPILEASFWATKAFWLIILLWAAGMTDSGWNKKRY